MRASLILITSALVLSACARTETPQEARERAQDVYAEYDRAAAEARANAGDEDEIVAGMSPGQIDTSSSESLTPGSWALVTEGADRMAHFGEAGSAPRITIGCELGGGIDIRLVGMPPQGGSQTIYISSPEGGSTFTASETVGDAPAGYISVPAADPFIGRLISGNGPFSLRLGGDQRLSFPADDVLTSVVSACDRRTAERAAAAAVASGDAATTPASPAPAGETR